MRGQVFDIEGVRFFTFGGARSHDIRDGILSMDDPDIREKKKKLNREQALFRIDHLSWWKEEMPSEAEMTEGLKNLEKAGNKVDCIISHCAPTSIQDVFSRGVYEHDTLTDYFEKIRRLCNFKTTNPIILRKRGQSQAAFLSGKEEAPEKRLNPKY